MSAVQVPAGDGSGRPFRWAIVGIGRHSRLYVVPAIARAQGGVLAALVTGNPDSARSFARPYGEPKIYREYAQALADPEVDGVFLVSPNDAHREQVVAAARAGKHVLCEKPLATTVADAATMVTAAAEAGIALGTGFHLRHNRVHEHARELIGTGRIGEVRFVSARYAHRTGPGSGPGPQVPKAMAPEIPPVAAWRRDPSITGGGGFVGTGAHAIDIVRYLTGLDFADVTTVADADDMREHNLAFVGHMVGGAIATVQGGDLPFPVNETVISGTKGSVVCRGSVGNLGQGTVTLIDARGEQSWSPPVHDVYVREVEHFATAVHHGAEASASGLDGLRCQEVIEAVYASASAGQLTHLGHALPDNEHVKE